MEFEPTKRQWQRALSIVGVAITISTLAVVVVVARRVGGGGTLPPLPGSPTFWIALAAAFLLVPLGEWVILRRLWQVPIGALVPLMRKQAVNELLLGYSGDAQFYLWAKRNVTDASAPFATLRDLAILSALSGNAATLVLMSIAWMWIPGIAAGPIAHGAVWVVCMIACAGIALALTQGRIFAFSLSRRQAGLVLGVHTARIATMLVLNAVLWSSVAPGIGLSSLLGLATARMMISRLPLVPGKDALFAGAVLAVVPHGTVLPGALALIAGITLGLHAVVAAVAGVREIASRARR